ncbi:pyruvate kinase isozyme A [Pyrus ussuriensis x Pyrus communis]|uniref:Pyruvate kinase isozyme A n=1 Tax=Pyrus ussuriensis x Pyrus communis TaxID=2448454 RepID=A0A5N5F2I3_9ROSA|nr:pyruvate kinase isozyme A [Pyrus ussuriensis x Pyrus communis]
MTSGPQLLHKPLFFDTTKTGPKKDFYALEVFEKMSEKGSEDQMEISHRKDLYNFENNSCIWNSCGCTFVVELLVSQFQGISATFHQYATSGPQVEDEFSQFQNMEFNHVAKAIENVGVRWIALPTASILFHDFDEKSKRQGECTMDTHFEFIFSLKDHQEINFGSLTVDLHPNFPVSFTSNLNFRLVWHPGNALAQAVKLMLYLQCKEGKHMDNLFNVQRLLHLLVVPSNIRRALLYEIERYKKKALVEQLGCLAIQFHCSDFNLETNNEENWSKEHNRANITVAMFLIVGTNVAPDTPKRLGCIARDDEGLVQFQWLDHRLKLVKRNYELPIRYTLDWRDIEFRIFGGVDLIGISVVNSAETVKQLKNHLFTKSAKSIRVFAKVVDVSEVVRQYAFNIVRSISIVEFLFDAFSQQ